MLEIETVIRIILWSPRTWTCIETISSVKSIANKYIHTHIMYIMIREGEEEEEGSEVRLKGEKERGSERLKGKENEWWWRERDRVWNNEVKKWHPYKISPATWILCRLFCSSVPIFSSNWATVRPAAVYTITMTHTNDVTEQVWRRKLGRVLCVTPG